MHAIESRTFATPSSAQTTDTHTLTHTHRKRQTGLTHSTHTHTLRHSRSTSGGDSLEFSVNMHAL